MPDDIITDSFKSMFLELKRHLDMATLRHWSKKIANVKNILNKSGEKYYSQNDVKECRSYALSLEFLD
jgi:hypothetical protein|tara:strand:+ start:36 stop:239 length:204 start_codon:yes stop_codon:yes gene_type:complete